MPHVTITTRQGRKAEQKKAILDGVHSALVEAFGIPDHDRIQVYTEVARDNWDTPGREELVIVEIKAFAGRSLDAKRALYKAVVRNLEGAGVESADVFIMVIDLPMENWGLRGGQAACDIDFGFKIDV